ncbi:MAG: hypothetical protein HGA87_02670 [Desulfobulbaceae bacterium]|nr:hypothetical protein [Desulfobulbaceae bacterium]
MKKTIVFLAILAMSGTAHATSKPATTQPTATAIGIAGAKADATAKAEQHQSQTQGQQQSQTSVQLQGNRQTTQITYKAARNLPGLTSTGSVDLRNPELMLNSEARMIGAAEAEIAATVGKGLNMHLKHSDDGVTAVVAYSATECTVHAFPSGSAKGITPAVLEAVAYEAAAKAGFTSLVLTGQYISIENHSNGFGASANPQASGVNAAGTAVGNIGALLTGNRGRTSERARVELVFSGAK